MKSFSTALGLFQNYQWNKSLESFIEISHEYPEDGPTHFYIDYLKQHGLLLPLKQAEQQALIEIGNITSLLHS